MIAGIRLVVLVLLLPLPVLADTLTGKVVIVTDGDTVYVQVATTRHKIRLQGIDAPERDQPYGTQSTKHLTQLIAGERVTVEWTKQDRYRRIVGKIQHNGEDIGLEQIRAGYAWHFKKYQRRTVTRGPGAVRSGRETGSAGEAGVVGGRAAGRFNEAVEPARRMFELDPVTPVWRANYAMALGYARLFDEAEALTEAVAAEPDSDIGTWWMGLCRAACREDRAEVLRLADGPYQQVAAWDAEVPWLLASAHAAVGAKDEALHWLDRAIEKGMISYEYRAYA